MSTPAPGEPIPSSYRIGTVSNLTGLDVHTIRAWERRHNAIEPQRSDGGSRLYDDATVERLQLLKAMVDCGEPIRVVAGLSDDELRKRLERLAGHSVARAPSAAPAAPRRLAWISPTLPARVGEEAHALAGFEVACSADAYDAAFVAELEREGCDVLVVDLEALGASPVTALSACRAVAPEATVVVTYQFARRLVLAQLARNGAQLLRGPVGLDQLRRTLSDLALTRRARARLVPVLDVDPEPTEFGDVPAPRYDERQLARLADIGSAIDCECPNHLAALISSLGAFETYSRNCESRDENDAELHQRLARGTGAARALMEDLLDDLRAAEAIELDPS